MESLTLVDRYAYSMTLFRNVSIIVALCFAKTIKLDTRRLQNVRFPHGNCRSKA